MLGVGGARKDARSFLRVWGGTQASWKAVLELGLLSSIALTKSEIGWEGWG